MEPLHPANDEKQMCLNNVDHLRLLVISRSATSGFSVIFCVLVFLWAIIRSCRQKYDINERLLIYLLIPSILYSLSVVLQFIVLYYDNPDSDYVIGCEIVGFFSLMLNWMLMIITFCIVIHLLLIYFCRPSCLEQQTSNSQKWLKGLEFFYISLTLLGPLLFVFWPFIDDYYGRDGTWCFIESHPVNCTTSLLGIMEQLFVWYVWKMLLTIFMFVSLIAIMSFIIYKKATRRQKRFRTLMALTAYLILHLISTIVAIVVRIILWSSDEYILSLGILYSVLDPSQALSAGIAVLIYLCNGLCSNGSEGFSILPNTA